MVGNASKFVTARKNPLALTDRRIHAIMQYFIYCYQLQIADKVTHSKGRLNTKLKFEDVLKSKLVDDYLRKNKEFFKSVNSTIEDIYFGKEEMEIYTDNGDLEQEDKIDISIRELGLQKIWSGDNKDEIYFAVECKRITKITDASLYVSDIQKFVDRKHTQKRIPFEGMLGFIEDNSIDHNAVAIAVNQKLAEVTTITTVTNLTVTNITPGFSGAYKSTHQKNYLPNQHFLVNHLLFDYSKIVVN